MNKLNKKDEHAPQQQNSATLQNSVDNQKRPDVKWKNIVEKK